MTHPVRKFAALAGFGAVLAFAAPPAPAQEQPDQQPDQGKVVATHGAWQVRCNQSGEVCIMGQVGKVEGKDLVEIQIRKLSGAKAPNGQPIPAAIQIVTPLGVLLPPGVRIQVDSKKERGAPFELCGEGGCIVRQPMDDAFINELKGGQVAKLTLVGGQQAIDVDISLAGFTKAFGALK